jgi:hypothetical protein
MSVLGAARLRRGAAPVQITPMGLPMAHFESLKPYTRPKRNVRPPSRLAERPSTAEPTWPINEIVLRTHVINGMNAEQIARRYHVTPDRVEELRKIFGV